MKKLNYLSLLVLGVVFISCGEKTSESKDGNDAELKEATTTDCLISELDGIDAKKNIAKKGTKDLYTGIAVEKDQNDSIIRKVEIKNGWLTKEITRKKINEKYITDSEYSYENGQLIDKYYLKIAEFSDESGNKFKYVSEYSPMNFDYDDNYYKVSPDYNKYDKTYQFDYADNRTETPLNFTKDFRENSFSGKGKWIITDTSPEKIYEILDAMKKELPHFDYWIEK